MARGRSRTPAPRRAASPRVRKAKHSKKQTRSRRWSREVAERSDALDLERGVFTSRDPRQIARSLKRSAERSSRRKAQPFQSAMSMLNLYINRAGRTLPASRRRILERAKQELRAAFGRAR
jgi:type IV secretory pathway VirB10-like protein